MQYPNCYHVRIAQGIRTLILRYTYLPSYSSSPRKGVVANDFCY